MFSICTIITNVDLFKYDKLKESLSYFVEITNMDDVIDINMNYHNKPTLIIGNDSCVKYLNCLPTQHIKNPELLDEEVFVETIKAFIRLSFRKFFDRNKIIDVDFLLNDFDISRLHIVGADLILHQINDYLLITDSSECTYCLNTKTAKLVKGFNLNEYVMLLSQNNNVHLSHWDGIEFSVDKYESIGDLYWLLTGEIFDFNEWLRHLQKITDDPSIRYHSSWFLMMLQIWLSIQPLSESAYKFKEWLPIVAKVEEYLSKQKHYIDIGYLVNAYRDIYKFTNIQRDYFIRLLKHLHDDTNYVVIKHNSKRTPSGRIICERKQIIDLIALPKDRVISNLIVPRHNNEFWSIDHRYFEPRIVAYIQDKKQFVDNDPYDFISEKVFGEVTEEFRQESKRIYASMVYGNNDYFEFLAKYDEKYYNALKEIWSEFKYVRDLRHDVEKRSWFENDMYCVINSFGRVIRTDAAYKVFNQYVQAVAADIVTRQIYKLINLFKSFDLITNVSFQKYDEIILDVYRPESERVVLILKGICDETTKFEHLRIRKGVTLGSLE